VQVSQRKNITAINNTLYNNNDGIYFRWKGSGLVLANNASYSPSGKAVNSGSAIPGAVFSNYVSGAMSGESIDEIRFINGGTAAIAFVNVAANDFWPAVSSPLRNTANATYIPTEDFNGNSRAALYDVGAYETNDQAANTGWKLIPGFKTTAAQTIPRGAPTNLRVNL
jgi:hypothetical protein